MTETSSTQNTEYTGNDRELLQGPGVVAVCPV